MSSTPPPLSTSHWCWHSLNRRYLLSTKLLYVTANLAIYSCYSFRPKFFKDVLNIDIGSYGNIAAVLALVSFFTSFFWTGLADKYGRHKTVLLGCASMSAVCFELLKVPVPSGMLSMYATVISALYIFFVNALMPLLDKLVLNMLSNTQGASKEMYGRQRLWGTVAYGLITFVTGKLLDVLGYDVIFYSVGINTMLFVVMAVFALPADKAKVNLTKLAKQSDIELNIEEREKKKSDSKKLLKSATKTPMYPTSIKLKYPVLALLLNTEYLFFLLVIFANGYARGILTLFLNFWMENDLWMSKEQVSVAANTGILLEIGIFFISKRLLDKWGIYWMLIAAQICMVARFWIYAFLPQDDMRIAYAVWAIELLKGANFGFMHSAGVQLANSIAPPHLSALSQGIYSGTFTGIATFVAGIVGGAMYEEEGAEYTFLITSIISSIALAVFLIKYGMIDRKLWQSKKAVKDSVECNKNESSKTKR